MNPTTLLSLAGGLMVVWLAVLVWAKATGHPLAGPWSVVKLNDEMAVERIGPDFYWWRSAAQKQARYMNRDVVGIGTRWVVRRRW